MSTTADEDTTAPHLATSNGHLAVTVELIKAGANLEARKVEGRTPLHLAAEGGHPGVVAALIEAGANVDSCSETGTTPLFEAARGGHVDAVKELLQAKANPLLAATSMGSKNALPLVIAVHGGHSEVVCELIQQVGIEVCGGDSAVLHALCAAAKNQHVETMPSLMGAGVVDTGEALVFAAGQGYEAPEVPLAAAAAGRIPKRLS